MELLNREVVNLLLEQRGRGPCISLYMPTQKGREKAKENSIRFKNLLAEAELLLEKAGHGVQSRIKLLDPAKKMVDESIFWANQSEGFAYFLSPSFSSYYRLPVEFNDLAVVRESFHTKPLFRMLAVDGQFYLLALSQKDARLLRGTLGSVEELDLSNMVEKFEKEFGEELPEQQLQFHTGAPVAGNQRSAVFFGHGGEIDSIQRERLLKYFRFIDRELNEMLSDKSAPLILACVDYLLPLYRDVSKYPLLFEKGIKGNPENTRKGELHGRAIDIVKPYFQQKQEEAKSRYREMAGTGKTSNDISEIVPASFHGRVSDLFVTVGTQLWGKYTPGSEKVEISEETVDVESEDLIDLSAAETFLNNGNIYVFNKEQMPDTGVVAALYRW